MKTDLPFDLVSTLNVISIEKVLSDTYKRKFPFKDNESFDTVIDIAKKGSLVKDVVDYVEGMYNNIIIDSPQFLEKFIAYNSGTIKAKIVKPIVEEAIVSNNVKKDKPVKLKFSKKLPKEYNKIRINEDIKANGGIATEFHKAMLELNDLKNIRARLNSKGKNRRYLGTNDLSDEDCRLIIATIRIVKNKLGKI